MRLLPVLPPVPVLLLVQEPVLLVQEPVPVLPVLLLEPVLLPEPRRNAALARMHRFFQVLLADRLAGCRHLCSNLPFDFLSFLFLIT